MTVSAPDQAVAPDFVDPFVAWRVWRVVNTREGFRLGSVVQTALWEPGRPLAAECLRSPLGTWFRRRRFRMHEAPDPSCACGIYAGCLSVIAAYLTDPPAGVGVAARVIGEVSLWGTVIDCERGVRASLAYPGRLYVPLDATARSETRLEEIVGALAAYEVPVEVLPARCCDAVRFLARTRVAAHSDG